MLLFLLNGQLAVQDFYAAMSRILLTGGRAPVTLELARLFAQTGHTVFVAESAPRHLCQASRAVARSYQVPPPKQAPAAFVAALLQLVQHAQIDWLIPTCEEVFYIAQAQAQLAAACHVLVDHLDKVHRLHNKWTFIQAAQQLGLPVPATTLLTSRQDVAELGPQISDMVLKPAYSRFATATRLPPHATHTLPLIRPTPDAPWVAQTYLRGDHFCTYSVAHHGRVCAHATYPVRWQAGQGAAIVFETVAHPQILAWVQTLVNHTQFHGQIAFDFIQPVGGEPVAIECNPRATSGIHLFSQDPRLVAALLGAATDLITPTPQRPAMLALAMLLYGPTNVRSVAQLRQWSGALLRGRDVIFRRDDLCPWFAQFATLYQFWRWSVQSQVDIVAATTLDIEWNGQPMAALPAKLDSRTADSKSSSGNNL